MELKRRYVDFRISLENIPMGTVILIPLVARKAENTETFSERVIELTTTDAGFYRAWGAHFYWKELGTVS